MTLWTWSEIKTKILADLDLADFSMITESEMMGYGNAAIDEAEQLVHTLNEDYLLSFENLALVTDQNTYDMPATIFAHKVRRVFYSNGSDKYEIKRIRNLTEIQSVEASDDYRYLVMNTAASGAKMQFFPASRETSSNNVTIYFLRNAARLTGDASVMDIPEAAQFVIARIKHECLRKEGHPGQVDMAEEVDRQRRLLVDTLTAMVPDEDNTILLDTTIYDEMV